jgi:hypothetical protein
MERASCCLLVCSSSGQMTRQGLPHRAAAVVALFIYVFQYNTLTHLSLQQPQKIYIIGGRTLPPLKRSVWDAPFIIFACLRGDLSGTANEVGTCVPPL